ncbi:MAG: lactoylglutathione lyase [Rhodopseudomonas palustris]|uniref:Aldoketomutase n=1 Tax=Rhodopseudomonas palustris TaxID=1076 RepID=A0A933S2B0_RHOPL|nr:lactoylglutathione lyase [Rhodopseudomonas palustris]
MLAELDAPRAEPTSRSSTLRIAVASSEGIRIDQHFGQADLFRVYDVSASGIVPVEDRDVGQYAEGEEDRRDTICRMLKDCQVLLVAKIGVTPQEKLAGVGIEAIDRFAGKGVEAALLEVFASKSAARSEAPLDTSQFQLLHAMLRVTDIDRAIDFYTRLLGMTVLERRDHKKNQFTQAYLGYGAGSSGMTIELVFNWTEDQPYTHGTSYGHIAIGVSGITALCDRLAAQGVTMPRPPRAQRHGESIVAFIEDPDGHRIELVQAPSAP